MARAAGLIAALLLAGCGETPAGQALSRLLPSREPPPVEAAPDGPALVLEAPRRVVLLPVSQAGGRTVWRGEGNVALATEGARVVATAGLGPMLLASHADGADPLEDPRALAGQRAAARRMLDLAGPDRDPASMRFGLRVECTLAGRQEGEWILVEERCAGEGLSFANRFWAVAETGEVLRSEQWAGDGAGLLRIGVR